MEYFYSEPENNPNECSYLESNFLHCLHEKSFQDKIDDRKCNTEFVMWYMLRCPQYYQKFKTPSGLKEHFNNYYGEVDLA